MYNGYPNYATWSVALRIGDYEAERVIEDLGKNANINEVAEYLKSMIYDESEQACIGSNDYLGDALDYFIRMIDFNELAEVVIDLMHGYNDDEEK